METKKIHSILFAFLLGTFAFTNTIKAQAVQVDLQDFTACAAGSFTALPNDFGASEWYIDDGTATGVPASNGYVSPNASGACYMVAVDGVDSPGDAESATYTISTAAYSNLSIIWGAYRDDGGCAGTFPAISLQYSTDGVTYTSVAYTEVANGGVWALVNGGTPISLPVACANQNTLYIRWSFTDDGCGSNRFYAWDDIQVMGTVNTYFSKAAGNLDALATWGTNLDGTGTSPANFTDVGIIYEAINNATPTIGANWTVSAGSKVRVGDVTTTPAINFTIPGGFSYSGTVDVANNATLTIQNTTIPTFGTLSTGSTVNYAAAGAQTIGNGTVSVIYHNLTISGGGTKTSPAQTYTVNGTLNLSAGDLVLPQNGLKKLILNGAITGAGTISGGVVPSTFGSISISGSAGAFGTLNMTPGQSTLKHFVINRTAPFTVTLGDSVTANGTFQPSTGTLDLNGQTVTTGTSCTTTFPAAGAGVIKGSATSNLIFKGSISGSLFMDQTSSSTKSLSSLTLNKATTLTIGNGLNIIDSIVPTLGTIASGGNVTLIADQTTVGHAGRIGIVGGSISGNIVSQVYHAPNTNNTDWRNLGSAGISNATFSAWNSQFPMTCPTCPNTQVGGQAFSSITTYKEADETYPDITYGGTITPGVGYWVYLGSSSPSTASAPYLISLTGTAQTGSLTTPVTFLDPGALTGYNLVANPYASPISFAKLKANNGALIANGWYTYSPGYANSAQYMAGTSNPPYSPGGTGIDDVIPSGMGFFVLANAGGSLSFSEDEKVAGSNEVLLRQNNPNSTQSAFTLFRMKVSGTSMVSEAVVKFDANASTGYDRDYDFPAMAPGIPGWLQINSFSLGKPYSINSLPDLTQNYSIPVSVTTATTGVYQFVAYDLQNMPSGVCLSLHDNYLSVDHDLRAGSFNLTITDTETVARFVLNVTVAPLSITTNAYQATCSNKTDAYLTAIGTNAGPWNYVWKDASNTVVKTSLNKASADSLLNLSNGVYSVDVNTVGTCDNATQTFTLTAPATIISAFTASSTTVNVNSNVTFTDNSANANAYWWTFGDGNTSNIQNPVYAYSTPGNYTVIFYAINAACGDTVSSTKTITVLGATSITSAASTEEIIFSKDQSGTYVKFNYGSQTRVNINVYNTLGQVVLANDIRNVTNDKIYINLENAKDQMIFVSIANLDKNTQVTKKLYNN